MMPAFQRYDSMLSAYGATMGQLYYYKALEEQGVLRWIKHAGALDAHVKAWTEANSDHAPLGFILSMEGADPVLHPEQVRNPDMVADSGLSRSSFIPGWLKR